MILDNIRSFTVLKCLCHLYESLHRADQSHRIPSHQPDQLIEQRSHKKQCGAQYNALSSIRIHFLLSVNLLHYTYLYNQIGHVQNDANNTYQSK